MDTRERILCAAKLEFAQKGFHRTLVSDIAIKARVGKGTIYRYFPSKEELFGAIIKSQMKNFEQHIKDIVEKGNNEVSILKEIGRLHFKEYRESKEVIAILVMEGLNKIGTIKQDFKISILNLQNLVCEVIESGIKKGLFKCVDAQKSSVVFLSLIWTILKHGIFMEENNLEEKYFDVIFKLFFDGLLNDGYNGFKED